MKKAVLLILLIILVIAGIGSYTAFQYLQPSNPNVTPEQPTPTPTKQPSQSEQSSSTPEQGVIKITATGLSGEYSNNEVAADLKYKERLLQVSGTIYKIGRATTDYGEYSNRAYVWLSANRYSTEGVLCFFKDESEIAKLTTEQEVIVEGKCKGTKRTLETSDVILSDSSLVEKTEFKLTGWEISVHARYSLTSKIESYSTWLLVKFTKFGYGISLSLLRPDGMDGGGYVLGAEVENGEAELIMSSENVVPASGQYKLVAKARDTIIATETLNFVGAKIGISKVSVQTTPGRQYGYPEEGVYLTNIILTMKNDGDLPFFAMTLEVSTSEENQNKSYNFQDFQPLAVLSGEEKIVAAFQYHGDDALRFASSGEKTIMLSFKDSIGKVVYSYSATINV